LRYGKNVKRGGEVVGVEFKPKLSLILAVFHGAPIALSYVVNQGEIKAMILWLAVSTGIATGLSYYNNQEKIENNNKHQKLIPN
jgi:hypothetical protein